MVVPREVPPTGHIGHCPNRGGETKGVAEGGHDDLNAVDASPMDLEDGTDVAEHRAASYHPMTLVGHPSIEQDLLIVHNPAHNRNEPSFRNVLRDCTRAEDLGVNTSRSGLSPGAGDLVQGARTIFPDPSVRWHTHHVDCWAETGMANSIHQKFDREMSKGADRNHLDRRRDRTYHLTCPLPLHRLSPL